MEPGAVGGAGHHQVDEFAGGAVADTVNAVALADESPLLLGLVLVLAQTDVAAVLDTLHSLNDAAGLGGDGVKRSASMIVCATDFIRFPSVSRGRISPELFSALFLSSRFCFFP